MRRIRPARPVPAAGAALALVLTLAACGSGSGSGGGVSDDASESAPAAKRSAAAPVKKSELSSATSRSKPRKPSRKPSAKPSKKKASQEPAAAAKSLPAPGNAGGGASVPAAGRAVDTSDPDRTVGSGSPASCTSDAVVRAVAAGGTIRFDCGPEPVVIRMQQTAKVVNTSSRVVLDGQGRVTLDGGGARRILYMNTCDAAQKWTTAHCDNQAAPHLTVQNMAFANGNATGQTEEGGGGGAIQARGGRLTVVDSRFTGNRCDASGPDLGGAAIRVLDQYQDQPVHVVGSTFEGGVCSNGGGVSGIGVSWQILNSRFTGNKAIGSGANPAKSGTPGGGSGGAVYADGNKFDIRIAGTVIENNTANEGGGAIFFVSNDRTGTLDYSGATLRANPSKGFETDGHPGIFFLGSSING